MARSTALEESVYQAEGDVLLFYNCDRVDGLELAQSTK